jgi:hypothetical protein
MEVGTIYLKEIGLEFDSPLTLYCSYICIKNGFVVLAASTFLCD